MKRAQGIEKLMVLRKLFGVVPSKRKVREFAEMTTKPSLVCSVCDGTTFSDSTVLWEELIDEWGINIEEAAYINRQQGTRCNSCGTSLRGVALGSAIQRHLRCTRTLRELESSKLRILDLNGCDGVSEALVPLPGYERHDYPYVDMHAMPFPDMTYDLVIHSDTLEHVADPILALRECLRVTALNGAVVFTIPIIVGRLSRNRAGLKESFHGAPSFGDRKDFVVHTEFGADCWTYGLRAGASSVIVTTAEFPSAQALTLYR